MKCPDCNYVSHDYLDACRSCGGDWSAFKAQVGLRAWPPGAVLDLGEVAAYRSRPTPPGADTGTPGAIPTLGFVEIEDEPSGDTGP